VILSHAPLCSCKSKEKEKEKKRNINNDLDVLPSHDTQKKKNQEFENGWRKIRMKWAT